MRRTNQLAAFLLAGCRQAPAAMLCKSTGFMTLVGTTTGGDGIGYDPLPLAMPNSGLLVRFSPRFTVPQRTARAASSGARNRISARP